MKAPQQTEQTYAALLAATSTHRACTSTTIRKRSCSRAKAPEHQLSVTSRLQLVLTFEDKAAEKTAQVVSGSELPVTCIA